MARFVYRMQSILNLKLQLEEAAKQRFSLARIRLSAEQEKLDGLYARKDDYLREGIELRKDDLHVQDILDNKAAILRMDEYIAVQEEEVRKAEKDLEKERRALQEVMTDRKAHEKLKERAFEQFQKEEAAAESRMIDELTTYRYSLSREESS